MCKYNVLAREWIEVNFTFYGSICYALQMHILRFYFVRQINLKVQLVPPITLARYCLYVTLLSIHVDVDVNNVPKLSKIVRYFRS